MCSALLWGYHAIALFLFALFHLLRPNWFYMPKTSSITENKLHTSILSQDVTITIPLPMVNRLIPNRDSSTMKNSSD